MNVCVFFLRLHNQQVELCGCKEIMYKRFCYSVLDRNKIRSVKYLIGRAFDAEENSGKKQKS